MKQKNKALAIFLELMGNIGQFFKFKNKDYQYVDALSTLIVAHIKNKKIML